MSTYGYNYTCMSPFQVALKKFPILYSDTYSRYYIAKFFFLFQKIKLIKYLSSMMEIYLQSTFLFFFFFIGRQCCVTPLCNSRLKNNITILSNEWEYTIQPVVSPHFKDNFKIISHIYTYC